MDLTPITTAPSYQLHILFLSNVVSVHMIAIISLTLKSPNFHDLIFWKPYSLLTGYLYRMSKFRTPNNIFLTSSTPLFPYAISIPTIKITVLLLSYQPRRASNETLLSLFKDFLSNYSRQIKDATKRGSLKLEKLYAL